VDLPHFLGDDLRPGISGGDLAIQVCANNPQVAFTRSTSSCGWRSIAKPRWLLAARQAARPRRSQALPRNLMGFQDGTANIKAEETSALREFVWGEGPASGLRWMRGGSYPGPANRDRARPWTKTARKVRNRRSAGTSWRATSCARAYRRRAHILLTSPSRTNGQRLLRRGYNFSDGIEHGAGVPAAGLMFLCYQADPRRQFIPIQRRIAGHDALSLYLRPVGSAIFACPPGAKPGGYVGESLLG
jgi:deferrochelatase/peroxidase EfeB